MTHGLASLLVNDSALSAQQTEVFPDSAALAEPQNGSDTRLLSQVLPKHAGSVGIMVFSSACKLLYANPTAFVFLTLLNRWETGHATDGALPRSVADLFDGMQLALISQMGNGEPAWRDAKHVLVMRDQTVQLQAFGLPDRLGMRGSRVVITMQGVRPPFNGTSSDAKPIAM